jgi:hypothetical protein
MRRRAGSRGSVGAYFERRTYRWVSCGGFGALSVAAIAWSETLVRIAVCGSVDTPLEICSFSKHGSWLVYFKVPF